MKRFKWFLKRISPTWLKSYYHNFSAALAGMYYGHPARKLRVIGVTGTNGKTTTCHLVAAILEQAGRVVGMETTVDFKIGRQLIENRSKMTTVSPWQLQKLLSKMVEAGCQDAVLEVTSIGLDQHRLRGITFNTAVFTNLTHDHLDYHGSMENYRLAKEKLFADHPELTVVNIDDPSAEHFLKYSADDRLTYGINNRADVMAKKILARPGGTDFVILVSTRQATISLPMPGEFNVYNALAAAATALGLGIELETVVNGLQSVTGVPGRMEVVDSGQSFTVIVDYAHTPDALQKVYETIRPTVHGNLISVLGSAGDRDKTKRPILGALAGRFADYVFVTNEDPYHEDPLDIINQVANGVPRGRPKHGGRLRINKDSEVPIKYQGTGEGEWWWRVPDRREALKEALKLARPQDVILVTGKGAEKVMVVGDNHIPWSDREVLEELLEKYQI